MTALERLEVSDALLLVIDVQDRLLPAIAGHEACTAGVRKLVQAARVLGLPTLLTEQYPAGLGRTCAPVREALAADVVAVEKTRFTACVDPVALRLRELNRRHVLVAGIETHICVQQTVLDLLRLGCVPYVCADAVSSRRVLDHDTGLARMRQAGAIVTTVESAVFEMLGEAGTEQFKQVLKIVK